MAIVSDFAVILGDTEVRVGDRATSWEKDFNTGGRVSGNAVLMLMVKGLTYATKTVDVKINDMTVGQIFPNYWPTKELRDADAEHWYTQIINVTGSMIKDGTNRMKIGAIGFGGSSPANEYDDFYIRDIVIFFQQKS
jgi:hypothetical protein